MIHVSGVRLWPAEVERLMRQLFPSIQEGALFGIPGLEKGAMLAAAVVLRPDARPSAENLVAGCKAQIAAYKVPAHREIIGKLPKSPSGKTLERVLRRRHGGP